MANGSKMQKHTEEILGILSDRYAELSGEPTLDYGAPWELLVATMLSAQCTDARVNMVTPALFRKYPDVRAFAAADPAEVEKDIRSVGLSRTKSKNIVHAAQKILKDFGGEVPSSIEALTSLPGVGRKTANVVRGHIFHIPSVVVDTHVARVSMRLGLTDTKDPVKAERELMEALPEDFWIRWNLWIIRFGREVCTARSPHCGDCPLAAVCPSREDVKPAG